MPHRRKHRIKLRSLYVWHRYIGVTVALFVIVLSITGVFLNHTERFNLDSRFVENDAILDWYGIHAPKKISSFVAGSRRVTLFGKHLYLDTRELPGDHDQLIGASIVSEYFVVAVDSQILLLSSDGDLVEQLGGADGVPSGMHRLGKDSTGQLIIDAAHTTYQPDEDFLEWKHADTNPQTVEWKRPSPLPEALYEALLTHYRGEVLPVERVLLDLHSGRIIGAYGIWVMDAAAVLLLLLALTGTWMWLKHRR